MVAYLPGCVCYNIKSTKYAAFLFFNSLNTRFGYNSWLGHNMLIKSPVDIPSSEITNQSAWLNRRQFLGASAAMTLANSSASGLDAGQPLKFRAAAGSERRSRRLHR